MGKGKPQSGGPPARPASTSAGLLDIVERLLAVPSPTLEAAMEQAASLVGKALSADKVDVWLHNSGLNALVVVGASDTPMSRAEREAGLDVLSLDANWRVLQVFRTGSPFCTGRADLDPQVLPAFHQVLGVRSMLCAPLEIRSERRGVLLASSAQPEAWADRDMDFLSAVARWVGMVAVRAELEEHLAGRASAEQMRALREASERTERLQAVTAALSGTLTRTDVADVMLDQGAAALGADAASVYLLNEEDGGDARLALVASKGYPSDARTEYTSLALEVSAPNTLAFRTRMPVWLANMADWDRQFPLGGAVHQEMGFVAGAAIPLQVQDHPIGVLTLSFRHERVFAPEEQALVAALAGQCAQALERARLYDAESQARRMAEEAVRARDEFLSIASHELRTPVTGIKGAAQLLQRLQARGRLDPERLQRFTDSIDGTATRLGRLIDDLLDVSRLRTGQFQLRLRPTQIAPLVEREVERAQARAQTHRLSIQVEETPATMLADPDRLEEVVSNLLDNAIKYSPGGGEIFTRLHEQSGGVLLEVRDSGIGLPPGSADSIFGPFGRASNARDANLPGMGLGLHISSQIITSHNGRIWAESAGEGQGSTFSVWLPIRTAAEPQTQPASAPPNAAT